MSESCQKSTSQTQTYSQKLLLLDDTKITETSVNRS